MGDRLKGRVAIVTGASRGIGLNIAHQYALQGARVVIAATNAETLKTAGAMIATAGRLEAAEVIDVSDREACFGLINRTVERLGKLDILVNNAAAYIPKPFIEYTHAEFSRVLDVNLHGPFHLLQAALPHMVAAGYGKVVNIASTAGKWGSVNQAAYNASKHGLVGITRCVALEMAGKGITVNAICPGMVDTDLAHSFTAAQSTISGVAENQVLEALMKRIPIGRYLDPAEVGHLAVYLGSSESDGMTGQSILLDGGMLMV